MKKLILTAAVVAANLVAFAQETVSTNEGFMPVKGEKTFEIEAVSPFSGGGATPFSLNNASLRFRYFLSDKMAFRTNFSLDISSNTNNIGGGEGSNNFSGTTNTTTSSLSNGAMATQNTLGFSIMPGIEFHKMVAKRLDVYYGAVIDFTLKSRSASFVVDKAGKAAGATDPNFAGSYKYEISGANFSDISSISAADLNQAITAANFSSPTTGVYGGPANFTNAKVGDDKSFMRIGLAGVLGADYYFMKGAYLGIEVTYGLGVQSNGIVKETHTNSLKGGSPTITTSNTAVYKNETLGSSTFNLVPNATAAFRLGVKF